MHRPTLSGVLDFSLTMSTRIAKTFESVRSGKLLGPTPDMKYMVTGGTGQFCRGCDDLIAEFDKAYHVRAMRGGDFALHLACAEAWIRFRREQHDIG
jgi:hypothetical protein